MIQSPVLSSIPVLPAAGDPPRFNPGEGAELADFGALLALSVSLGTAEAAPGEVADAPLLAAPPAEGSPATGGKSLPVSLPPALPVIDVPKPATAQSEPVPPSQPIKPDIPVSRVLGKAKAETEFGEPAQTSADASEITEAPPVSVAVLSEATPPVQPTVQLSVAVPLPASVPAAVEAAAPESDLSAPPAPQPAAAALVHAAPQAAFLRGLRPGRSTGQAPDGEAALPVQPPSQLQPQTVAAAPASIGQVRIELPPVPPVMRALPKDERLPVETVPALDTAAAPAAGSANPALSANPAPALTQPLDQPTRPQDFSALIDRLVAARDASQPQAIAVSVPHVEFGQIHLRFRQDEAGLAVAMTSADPGFARAASAMPPVLPVSDPQAAQNQPGQTSARQDSAAGTGQSGNGQQRGTASERRHDQPHSNHAPASARQGQGQRRPGIFA